MEIGGPQANGLTGLDMKISPLEGGRDYTESKSKNIVGFSHCQRSQEEQPRREANRERDAKNPEQHEAHVKDSTRHQI